MEPKSEKGLVSKWIIGCLAVIGIFHFAWAKYLFMNWSGSAFFTIVDALLFLVFAGVSAVAYKNADDPNFDFTRKIFIGLAIASSIWAAAWSTGLMNNISQGING